MSLQVWLPLNGDLHNQGLSTVIITNNGAIIDNNGKIGKCYYFNGSSYIKITMPDNMTTLYNTSVCAWIKSASTTVALGGISNDVNYTVPMCTLYTSGWQFGNAAQNGYRYLSGGAIANTNIWHHVACTISDNLIITYLDGIKVTSGEVTGPVNFTSSNFIEIGCDHPGGNEYLTGYVNDFRVYDHCLSDKEVKEIAQGLVLHYPLNNIINKNFYTGNGVGSLSNTSSISNSRYNSTFVLSNTGSVRIQNLGFNGRTGPWVASFDIKSSVATTVTVDICDRGYSIAKYGVNLIANQWMHKSFTITTATDQYNISSNYNGFIDFNCGAAGTYNLKNLKVEEGTYETAFCESVYDTTVVYDSSGYNHNGIIIGNVIPNNLSPKYQIGTWLSDSASSIKIGNLSTIIPKGIFTFNIWFKKVTGEWSSKSWETILGGPSGFELEAKMSSNNTNYIHPYSWGGGSTGTPNSYSFQYSLDEWHMLTMVRTTSDTKFYLDGVLKVTGTAGSIPSGNYFIGSWSTATGQNYRGYFSDARIYATAFSAADILELYKISKVVNGTIATARDLE